MSDKVLKVKCIDNEGYSENLTIDNIYEVIDEDGSEYKVKDNKGNYWYWKGRFEIMKEDNQIKEYTLKEVFDLPEGIEFINTDAHFEVKNGVLYNWFKPNDKQTVRLTKIYVNMRFIKVQESVSFMEAIQSGKKIKCIHDRFGSSGMYLKISEIFELMSKSSFDDFIPTLVNEGKWYIEEN